MSQWQRSFGACIAALLCALAARASESKFVGSQSCNSTSCHGRSEPRRTSVGNAGPGLQEFQLYVRHDPHANAARTLAGPEFQAMLSRLSGTESGISRAAVYQQCAACHDPEGLASAKVEHAELTPPEIGRGTAGRGISCETCHGGAKGWLTTHYQRDASRSSLVNAGMRDTKDLAVRAALCAACHVGGAGRDVNHDLLAEGHPPLRFELAAYHRKLTSHDQEENQSHWNDARERIVTSEFEVQLWEAGQIASAKAALGLLQDRAQHAAQFSGENPRQRTPWPEFAEYDCFGCHQKIRPSTDGKPNGEGEFPAWGEWNLAILQKPTSSRTLDSLRQEMQKGFAAQPAVVGVFSHQANSMFATTPVAEISVSNLLRTVQQPIEGPWSWNALCGRYLALRAIQKCNGDEFRKLELSGRVISAQRSEFNRLRNEIDRELGAIGRQLSFADDTKEWPRVLADPKGLETTATSLAAAAEKIGALQNHIEQRR